MTQSIIQSPSHIKTEGVVSMNKEKQPSVSSSLWLRILKDAQTTENDKQEANVLILGDERNGRRSVIRKLIGKDVTEVKHENSVLDYTFMRVKADYGENLISLWSFGEHNLINLIENNSNLQPPSLKLIIITADVSRPGKLFMELEKWVDVVKKLYSNNDRTQKENVKLLWAKSNPENSSKRTEELDTLNLGENVLTTNVGIPIIFLLTKSDLATDELENHLSSCGLNIDLLQQYQHFIMYKLRSMALSYGASLFITSSVKGTNIDRLRQNIFHTLNGTSSSIENGIEQEDESRSIVSYESACIYMGEDSMDKINTLDLSMLFSTTEEARFINVKELIPEERGILVELEGYMKESSSSQQQDLGEYVSVIDYQSFLARQVKSQSLYKSRSSNNVNPSSIRLSRSSNNLTTPELTKHRLTSTGSLSNIDPTSIVVPQLGSGNSSGTGHLETNTSHSMDIQATTKLEEEAEDFFNSMLKKMKK